MKRKILIGLGILTFLATVHLLGLAFYARPVTFARPIDLNRQDCRIGVMAGGDSERIGRRVYARAQIVGFDDFEDAFTALLGGGIDGFVYSDHVLNVGLRAYPNRFKMLDESLGDKQAVVLLSPQRGDLLPELNKFIANCRQIGVYDEMVARWCQNDTYEGMPEIPEADGSKGVLKVGTSGEQEPSSFVDDAGHVTGFDVEFARRFAQMMGLKPEIVCMPNGAILEALNNGELDMVVDNYTVTEAIPGIRSSDDYFDSEMKVLVRSGDEERMSLGSTRLGYSKRFLTDPRLVLIIRGILTTTSVLLMTLLVTLAIASGVIVLERQLKPQYGGYMMTVIHVVRLIPPPIVLLVFAIFTPMGLSGVAFVLALAVGFAARIVPVLKLPMIEALPFLRNRAIDLLHWSTVGGLLMVCDLVFACDLVFGRSLLALGPLVSVATAYVLVGWGIEILFRKLEEKLKK